MPDIISTVRASLLDIVAVIDAAPPPPAPAPAPPAPAPQTFKTIAACFQLFGPVQLNGSLQQIPGPDFGFQGNALTASTKQIYLGPNSADVDVARVVAVWAPGSAANEIELVKFDNGPTNIERIALMSGQNVSTPVASGAVITQALQAMVDEAKLNGTPFKHLGFRMRGPATYTMFEVRVEVSWRIPA